MIESERMTADAGASAPAVDPGGRPPSPGPTGGESSSPEPTGGESPSWAEALARVGAGPSAESGPDRLREALGESAPPNVYYHLDLRESRLRDRLVVDLVRECSGRLEPLELGDGDPAGLADQDREIVGLLFGAHGEARGRGRHAPGASLGRAAIRPSLYRTLLPRLAATGRFRVDLGVPGFEPTGALGYDEGELEVVLAVAAVDPAREDDARPARYRLTAALARSGERWAVESTKLLLSDGLALIDDRLLRVRADEHLGWALRLRRHGPVEFPAGARDHFLLELARMPDLPPLDLPPELHWSQVSVAPVPKMVFAPDEPEDEAEEAEEPASRSPFLLARVEIGRASCRERVCHRV